MPGLSRNRSGEGGGSALPLSQYLTYGSSSFAILLLCLHHDRLLAAKTSVRFAFIHCRTGTLLLCQSQFLVSDQKGVLFDCNPTHLSLDTGAFSFWLRQHNDILCLGEARQRLTSVTLHAS